MIKMKAVRSFHGASEGRHIRRGHEFEVRDDRRAKEIEAHGLGYRIEMNKAVVSQERAAAALPDENKAAQSGPFDLVGGEIGAVPEPAPSSHPGRRPRSRKSDVSEEKPQS